MDVEQGNYFALQVDNSAGFHDDGRAAGMLHQFLRELVEGSIPSAISGMDWALGKQ